MWLKQLTGLLQEKFVKKGRHILGHTLVYNVNQPFILS